MQHVWGKRKLKRKFQLENLKAEDSFMESVCCKIFLKLCFKRNEYECVNCIKGGQ
jgi:hypothetical protein